MFLVLLSSEYCHPYVHFRNRVLYSSRRCCAHACGQAPLCAFVSSAAHGVHTQFSSGTQETTPCATIPPNTPQANRIHTIQQRRTTTSTSTSAATATARAAGLASSVHQNAAAVRSAARVKVVGGTDAAGVDARTGARSEPRRTGARSIVAGCNCLGPEVRG